MKNSAATVIFLETPYNRYSLAVLTGVLEADERLQEVDLHFVAIENRRRPGRINVPVCVEHIRTLARQYSKAVLALSFHTASIIAVASLLDALHQELITGPHEAVLIVTGGPHPSGDPARTLRLGADVVVAGEGEITFPTLLDHVFRERSFAAIKGLWFLDGDGQPHYTGKPAPADLSDFPPFAMRQKRFCPIEISRGCPHGCRFCQTTFLMGAQMRHRSLESLLYYAELPRRLGMRVLRFITPSALAYGSPDGRTVQLDVLEQMLRAASEMYGKDEVYFGSFPSEIRPEQVSPDALDLIAQYCANTTVMIGAQSGSERMLQALHRGHGVADILQAVELTVKAGLSPNVDIMFGLPGETTHDRRETLHLIHRLIRMGARVHSHAFMPLAGTPLANCPPGVLDDDVRDLLMHLRGKKLEHGRWREHERLARTTFEFLNQA